ncbi:MAG: hypothetical protein J3Q66DRAFT_351162 [Benniella sp.]|nr:MAG: hypothetical protein J3Q66DRAFT_351162 [Benniella sp.]
MGNTSTKEKSDHVDGGALLPHGVYSGPQDYDFRIVQRLILQRKLAPFYKGLEDWDDNEDALEEKAKQLKTAAASASSPSGARQGHARTTSTQSQTRANHMTEAERDMRRLYQGAIECPICFLYYPRNINRTRCCDKPMCTECFVQLKRSESAPAESPACPYCVEPHFGVIYSSSLVPSGLLSSPTSTAFQSVVGGTSMSVSSSSNSIERGSETTSPSSPTPRRRSTSHKSPEVVTADDLRPDWNRRILAAVQRQQPGSRRASTSSPVSNATFGLGRRLAAGRQGTSSRRSNSSTAASEYNGYITAMRNMGTDLEELMIMEAMRQSLQDEQERQAREAAAASSSSTTPENPDADANTLPSVLSHFGESSRSGIGRGSATSRSPLSSPIAPPSTSSSSSTTAHRFTRGLLLRGEEEDISSLNTSDGDNDSETDSDQDRPELLHNDSIRFARISLPASAQTPVTRKHPTHEGRTNAPEAV